MRVKNLRSAGLLGVGVIIIASVALSACGDLAKRLTSKVAAVNLLLNTSDPFGAGVEKSAVVVNLVSITGPLSQPTASPIDGAGVSMDVGSGASPTHVILNESNPGSYEAVSGSAGAAAFVYASNQVYSISMNVPSGDFSGTYTTKVTAPPRTEVSGLPANIFTPIPANQPLTLTITSGTYDFGIVVVVDSMGTVTYSNKPQTPQDFVNFVLNDFNGMITIPATAFPNAGSHYGITVAGLKSAPASGISPNLEILTHFLAGSAKTAIVSTN